jgi:hypothetical protein
LLVVGEQDASFTRETLPAGIFVRFVFFDPFCVRCFFVGYRTVPAPPTGMLFFFDVPFAFACEGGGFKRGEGFYYLSSLLQSPLP